MTAALAAEAATVDDTASRLAQIRERAAAATPGVPQWLVEMGGSGHEVYSGPLSDSSEDIASHIFHRADAEFIAAARQDIPYLLDLVDALTRELADARSGADTAS